MKDKISSSCDSNLDWEYIINFTARHRLRPLLYHNLNSICPEKVPEDILKDLKVFYHENVRKNLMLTGELVKIMELFKNNGIDAVAYKGPVLASQAYGNIGLREFGDIDILIDKKNALGVRKLMINNGYEFYPQINFKDDFYCLKLMTELRFINKNNKSIIEIKWKFEGNYFSLPMLPSFISNKIDNYNLNGYNLNIFSPESQVIIMSIHSSKHYWKRLSWICDFSEFIRKENINWNEVKVSSKKLSIHRILLINLILAKELFDLKLPEDIDHELNSNRIAKNIAIQIIKKNLNQKQGIIFEKFFLDLNKRDRVYYGIKDFFNIFFRANHIDYNDFPLPNQFFPLYPLFRPFLMLKRYFKRHM